MVVSRRCPRCLLALVVLLGVSACAGRSTDPFAAAGARAEGGEAETYRVRFEVSCDRCSIQWGVGPYGGDASEEGVWSRAVTLGLRAGERVRAHLSAAPAPESRPVSRVRIAVDAEVVAEAEGDVAGAPDRRTVRALSVETPVPPNPSVTPSPRGAR